MKGEEKEESSSPNGRDGDGGGRSVLFSDEDDGRSQQGLVLVGQENFPRSGIGGDGTDGRGGRRRRRGKGELSSPPVLKPPASLPSQAR